MKHIASAREQSCSGFIPRWHRRRYSRKRADLAARAELKGSRPRLRDPEEPVNLTAVMFMIHEFVVVNCQMPASFAALITVYCRSNTLGRIESINVGQSRLDRFCEVPQ